MVTFMKYPAWQKEWEQLLRQEKQFTARQSKPRKPLPASEAIGEKIPPTLQSTLDTAFLKGFELVFSKGTVVIEKTYGKAQQQDLYKVNRYAARLRQDRKAARAFIRQAHSVNRKNLLISGVEGVGLGVLGIGLPDIPLFVSLLLKSIYEIALSFGFDYESEQEQSFILQLIAAALRNGPEAAPADADLNSLIYRINSGQPVVAALEEQCQLVAKALSSELLFLKFVQGIPIAGVLGGLSDFIYLKRITDYATLKYRRRFLLKMKREQQG